MLIRHTALSQVQLYPFLNSVPDASEWSSHATVPLPHLKRVAGAHWQETGWAPAQVWILWRRENPLAPARNWNQDCPTHSLFINWAMLVMKQN